uniref:Serine aminopeptidase S33 domain-containing protein n=1 Tax=Strombidium rassoulzadegani TaxID=1082188 RepID=A0A7S3CTU1_9SPIT|mmetsp:Transcript_8550/g.14422  ORF Transcript_8550/g.14422 Transcript_8550/m.14422 type:complete len:290 (+) Transcript_8550:152-1021(+)
MGMYAGLFVSMMVGMVYFKQDGMLYHPAVPDERYRYPQNMPPGYRNPRELGMDYEDCQIVTKDKVKLHAWFVKASATPKMSRTLIFFHGNAGNIGSRLPNIDLLVKRLNTNVLILAYRGYGNSEGTPSEDGLRLDAEATFEYALSRSDIINPDRIFVFGRSLGGAVAIQLAVTKSAHLKGIIVENTFTSIADMVDQLMPMVAMFKSLIQRLFYPSIDRVPHVQCPILFVRGNKDEIVPHDHSQRLFAAAKGAKFKRLFECEDGDHNNTWKIAGEKYVQAFKEYFVECEK